jgi:L-2-hydroxyglutarate oxidase LhgO
MGENTTDFLVIGAGVIGVRLALEAKRRHPGSRVTVIEKEERPALHASGRNSGVLHAGFYYSADSLKARFTREGNRELTAYCDERGLRINKCGKLVVAQSERELAGLDELLRRARRNGVELHEITAREARDIEPRVRTCERALFSPTTSSVDPKEVMAGLVADARAAGVQVLTGTAYLGRENGGLRTSRGRIDAGYVINAAGLYADRIARDYGFSRRYRILPFKGLYLYADEGARAVRTHIYPVPDLERPFLGVHYTVTAEGKTKIGPTAIPAFWREHYRGLGGFRLRELVEIVGREAWLFLRNDFGFRGLALEELRKYARSRMASLAGNLVTDVRPADYRRWGPPGIRAQLLDIEQGKLEMDFRFEGDRSSFHVLNAVSPAFTCSFPFAAFLFDEIDRLLGGAPAAMGQS